MKKNFEKILDWFLNESNLIAITPHQLYIKLVHTLDQDEELESYLEKLLTRSEKALFRRLVRKFMQNELIGVNYSENLEVLYFYNQMKIANEDFLEEKIVQEIYPFGYFSYGSSLQIHKFSKPNLENVITYTIPDRKNWVSLYFDELPTLSNEKVERKFFSNLNKKLWHMPYPKEQTILRKKVVLFSKKNISIPKIQNSLRVEDLSETIMISTQQPQYYGGITKVIDLHRKLLENPNLIGDYFKLVNQKGGLIDKARIGYILDSLLNFKHPIIDGWKSQNTGKRGGSRKLISYLPYSEIYDPEWNLSLNTKNPKE